MPADAPRIDRVDVAAYRIPTDRPEADGTLEWCATTLVVVTVQAGAHSGLGYSYTHHAAAELVRDRLADVVTGRDAFAIPACWQAMIDAVRNLGRPGLASAAIAAVDTALWDLKARCLELPLVDLLGCARDAVPVYGSGGFTSESPSELADQLAGWTQGGIPRVKMKVGTAPSRDRQRVAAARAAIGPDAELFVDANGAYARKQALAFAEAFVDEGVSWFEEPVTSDDLEGLRLLRDRAPAGLEIAAGEYGYDLYYFRHMLEAGAVDVLQADATRCAGCTGFLQVTALCQSRNVPLSAHTAPALHLHLACAAPAVRHIEYFYDHVRIESMAFDGVQAPSGGCLAPDRSRAGHGLTFRAADVAEYRL